MNAKPILLIHGMAGCRMQAVSKKTGQAVDVWFPKMSPWYNQGLLRYLWGAVNPQTGVFESYCSDEYSVEPVKGLYGCRMLSEQWLATSPLLRQRFEYFDNLADWLESEYGYREDETLFAFTYDWRQDVTGPLIQGQLQQMLEHIHEKTQQPVRVFCHSMGGLVARSFLQQKPELASKLIHSVITGGTPWNGCAADVIMGYHRGITLGLPLSKLVMRGILSHGASSYSIIPTKWNGSAYVIENHQPSQLKEDYPKLDQPLQELGQKLVTSEKILGEKPAIVLSDAECQKLYFDQAKVQTIQQTGQDVSIDSLESLIAFFHSEKIPGSVTDRFLEFDEALLKDVIARITMPDTSGVKVTCLCGTGVPTVKQMRYKNVSAQYTQFLDAHETVYEEGDGLVPLGSATFLKNAEIRVFQNFRHSDLRRATIGPTLAEIWELGK